jgi:membrane protease YdiL (CAAX protease family)
LKEAALALIGGGLALASLTVWILVLVRRSVGYPIVEAEPRRDVPWGFVDVLLVLVGFLFFAIMAQAVVWGLFVPPGADKPEPPLEPVKDWTPLLIVDGLAKVATIALAVFLGVSRGRATAADFGLTARHIAHDVKLGVLGFLAALLPVYCVQAVVIQIIPPEKQHPVLEMLSVKSGVAALAVAVLFAVVLAPLAEEFLFRAFLQGWLEKSSWRSSSVERMDANQPPPGGPISSPLPIDVEPIESAADWHELTAPSFENPYAPPATATTQDSVRAADASADSSSNDAARTPVRSHYIAIVISSLVFAVLHASNWPAPVPLFFLALILGYLYSRTHRLLPCIVVHFLFNALSVAAVILGMTAE